MEKIKVMLGSVRFWYAVLMSIALLLDQLDIVPGAYAKAIELFTSLGIGIRTVEKVAEKI